MRKTRTGALLRSRSLKGARRTAGLRSSSSRAAAAQFAFGDQAVDEPELERLLRAHRLAGQHQLHRGPHADETHGTHRAAEAWVQSKLYLRQPERQPFIRHRDAVAAGERGLQSAAEGKAVDGGDGGAGQRLQAIKDRLTATDEGVPGRLVRERGEFADIGARDETALLGGDEHEAARSLRL